MGARGYDKENPFAVKFCDWKLDEPLLHKKPSIIGVSFMGDLFHYDINKKEIFDVFEVMMEAEQHTFILCTKRPQRILSFVEKFDFNKTFIPNVWFGCSIEDKKSFYTRMPFMVALKKEYGINTWLSIEPLLEDLSGINPDWLKHIDQVIVGGESGTGARYCDPTWIVKIQDICKNKNIPFYFKQWGTNKQNYDVRYTGKSFAEMGFLRNITDNDIFCTVTDIEQIKQLAWKR